MGTNGQQSPAGHTLLVRKKGLPTAASYSFKPVQMKKDRLGQMFSLWAKQTNKHALNSCYSAADLSRYKRRHVLEILTKWLLSSMKEECEIFVDLIGQTYRPISGAFRSLRPDIVIIQKKSISNLELTTCHKNNST